MSLIKFNMSGDRVIITDKNGNIHYCNPKEYDWGFDAQREIEGKPPIYMTPAGQAGDNDSGTMPLDYFGKDEVDWAASDGTAAPATNADAVILIGDTFFFSVGGSGGGSTVPPVVVNDTLVSTSTVHALSAAQGKVLKDLIDAMPVIHNTLYIDDAAAITAGVTSGQYYPLADGNQWFLLEGTLRRMP